MAEHYYVTYYIAVNFMSDDWEPQSDIFKFDEPHDLCNFMMDIDDLVKAGEIEQPQISISYDEST